MAGKRISAADARVIADEATAEAAYQESLRVAEQRARVLADVKILTDGRRAAAEAAAAALPKIEEARQRALIEPTPEAATRTFRQCLADWFRA